MTSPHPVIGPWNLADLDKIERNGLRVFSCFCCGGGSTMGYKLAGYTVLGGVEIDPEMMSIYRENHHPAHSFLMPVQDFATLPDADIPPELFDLDILDGSPPCSAFSMAGDRDRKWGVTAHFREGQVAQRLDDLFFHFIALAKRLQPKAVIAENVKGLIIGKAKGYVAEIFRAFEDAGYNCQLFLLNASRMGVPQARERTFFIALRRDLKRGPVSLAFNEPAITVQEAWEGLPPQSGPQASPSIIKHLLRTAPGKSLSSVHPKGSFFNITKLHPDKPANTVIASCHTYHPKDPRRITGDEAKRLQSFPEDYNSLKTDIRYVCGMSVPPLMMQRVALELGRQLFDRAYDSTRGPL